MQEATQRARRELIIVRTYKADTASLEAFDLYDSLEGFDTVFCVDERNAQADMGGRAKVVFDNVRLEAMGLYPHPDCGWQCGDYFYHVARSDLPDYDFYWLIEPDVRINTDDLAGFFAQFARSTADLLAPRLTFNDETWSWNKEIAATGLPPWRCFFPITRLSGRAIDHVYATRREQGLNPAIAGRKTWPNDEGITASALANGDFVCADLNHDGIICHNTNSLNGVALIDPGVLARKPPDGLVYHPVRDFAHWFAEACAQLKRIAQEESGPPKSPRSLIGQARALTRMAQTCLRHPDYADAALEPSVLGVHLWSTRPNMENLSTFIRAFDERSAHLCMQRLQGHFGVSHHRRLSGTVHMAVCRATEPDAAATDFELGPPFELGRFPRTAALPYAWDLETRELLATVHLSATAIMAEPRLVAAQRAGTRVVAKAPLARLRAIYGGRQDSAPLVLGVAADEAVAEGEAARLRAEGMPVAVLPGTLTQLAGALPLLGRGIEGHVFLDLIRYSILPLLQVTHPGAAGGRRVVIVPALPERMMAMLKRVFPDAEHLIF
jgi:hypothetical protein